MMIEEHEDKVNQHPAKINFPLCQFMKTSLIISPTRKLRVMASRNLGD